MVTRGKRVYIQSGTCERQLCDVVVVVVTTIASGVSRCRDSDGSMGLIRCLKGGTDLSGAGVSGRFHKKNCAEVARKLREVARKK